MLECYNLPLHTAKWQRKRSTSVKMFGKNYNRPFPYYAVSKHKELRTRIGWTISCKSLYFQSFRFSVDQNPVTAFLSGTSLKYLKTAFLYQAEWPEVKSRHIKLMHLSMLSWWGRQGIGWGFGDLTFFKNLPSNSLPLFQSTATKFLHPGMHIAVHPKAGPKKGIIKISPNKTLQSFFINVTASPKIKLQLYVLTIQSVF